MTFFGVKLNVLFMPCNLTRLHFPLSLLVQILMIFLSYLCDSSMLMICMLLMQSSTITRWIFRENTTYLHIQNANLVFINLVLAVFSATQVESRGQLLLHAPSGCGHFKILATSLDIYLVMGYGYPNMKFQVLEVISFQDMD